MLDPRYRFGQLERRGVLAGLRGSQLTILFCAALVSVLAMRSLPPGVALVAALSTAVVGATAAFVPLGGRTFDEWVPVLSAWLGKTVTNQRSFTSRQPTTGLTVDGGSQPHLPASLAGLSILSHVVPGQSSQIGILKDQKGGTYTGV